MKRTALDWFQLGRAARVLTSTGAKVAFMLFGRAVEDREAALELASLFNGGWI